MDCNCVEDKQVPIGCFIFFMVFYSILIGFIAYIFIIQMYINYTRKETSIATVDAIAVVDATAVSNSNNVVVII